MREFLLVVLFSICSTSVFSQTRIDGAFSFQTDPAKKYSLYIPSSYDENEPNRLMIGFHPFNTNRWDAESWCDTLIVFAETNNLILACPDGGIDGAVDDAIDTAFTSVLIDSVYHWYNINPDKVYGMGFSVGGRATYTYGLNHIEKFRGFIPIGAAVNGTSEVNAIIQNAEGHPYYLVHGGNDSPGTRFTPIKTALENNNAIVNSILMTGVGHTIDFPNRNQILTTAFEWVDSVNCALITSMDFVNPFNAEISLFPNPIVTGQSLSLSTSESISDPVTLKIMGIDGKQIISKTVNSFEKGINHLPVSTDKLKAGLYILQLYKNENFIKSFPFVVN